MTMLGLLKNLIKKGKLFRNYKNFVIAKYQTTLEVQRDIKKEIFKRLLRPELQRNTEIFPTILLSISSPLQTPKTK